MRVPTWEGAKSWSVYVNVVSEVCGAGRGKERRRSMKMFNVVAEVC